MPDSPEPNNREDHEAAAGDPDFDELYRDHVDDARRLATILVGTDRAEELVAESFARVLARMREGQGPTTDFRSYLHVTIRNGFRDMRRRTSEAPVSDQPWLFDTDQLTAQPAVPDFDSRAAATAFATLPASWQQVLWHLEIEDRKPGEVAEILGMRPRAVSSLAHRAREGLRQAYLDAHLASGPTEADCTWTRRRLSKHVRGDLSPRADAKVTAHLEHCSYCTPAYLEVEYVNKKLAAYWVPLVLAGAFPASGVSPAWLVSLWSAGGSASVGAATSTATSAATSATATTTSVGGFSGTLLVGVVAAAAAVAGAGGLAWKLTADNDRVDIVSVPSPTDPTPSGTPTGRPAPGEKPEVDPAGPEGPLNRPPVQPPVVPIRAEPDPVVPEQPTDPSNTPVMPVMPVEPRPKPEVPPREPPKPPVDPGPIAVRPVRPIESLVPAVGCEVDGSLVLPTTEGLRYDLVTGDGRTGPWQVSATALDGYAIETGAPAEFTGDLGQRVPCTRLASANSRPDGDPPLTPWQIEVVPDVIGGPNRTISAVIDFDRGMLIPAGAVSGAGWSCRTSDGTQVGDLIEFVFGIGGQTIICEYDYSGAPPPPLGLRVITLDLTPDPVSPAASVTLRSGADEVGTAPLR